VYYIIFIFIKVWHKNCSNNTHNNSGIVGTFFYTVTLCSLLQIYQRLGGVYCFHLRGRRVSKPRREHGMQGEKDTTVRVSQWERVKMSQERM
jgi:hypothetical protein